MSSYRVMPIAGSIGQAGGVAAALCVRNKHDLRNLDYKQLRKTLAGPGQNAILDL
jgi:Holliday junction resolvasome RuvABC endonuclease subunit